MVSFAGSHIFFYYEFFRLIIWLLCYKGSTIQAVTAKILSWLKFGHSEKAAKIKNGGFNLHLLDFTFINQFYFRKTILVESIFWNPVGLFAFISFHNHFKLSSTLFNLHLFPFKLCGLLRKAELYWQVG